MAPAAAEISAAVGQVVEAVFAEVVGEVVPFVEVGVVELFEDADGPDEPHPAKSRAIKRVNATPVPRSPRGANRADVSFPLQWSLRGRLPRNPGTLDVVSRSMSRWP